jgi:hypothetical protein
MLAIAFSWSRWHAVPSARGNVTCKNAIFQFFKIVIKTFVHRLRPWPHHTMSETMSDSESSVGGAAHSRRAGPAKTRAKRKARHVDSTSDDLEDDDAAFSDDGPHESGRAKLSWTRITTTLTWADADVVFRDLACKECNGYALRERHDFRTQFSSLRSTFCNHTVLRQPP